jgi:hypothetical protein
LMHKITLSRCFLLQCNAFNHYKNMAILTRHRIKTLANLIPPRYSVKDLNIIVQLPRISLQLRRLWMINLLGMQGI